MSKQGEETTVPLERTKKRLTVKSVDFYSLVEPNRACGTFWVHDGVLVIGMRCDWKGVEACTGWKKVQPY